MAVDGKFAVAVIGGGAAGMAASAVAAEYPRRIVDGDGEDGGEGILCLERNDAPGRKLLATGNGRCNLTNAACSESKELLLFFRKIGVLTRLEEGGRFYPYSGQATAVRNSLYVEMKRRGVDLRCNSPVKSVRREERYFEIETEGGEIFRAIALVLATGGKAGPQYGSFGDGYAFARSFGHSVVSPLPALVRMVCEEGQRHRLRALKGVRVKCEAALWIGVSAVGRASGELQFTEDGLSGICIFDLSRYMRMKGSQVCRVELDFAPETEERMLINLLSDNRAASLSGVVPDKIAALIDSETKGNPRAAARMLKHMEFPVAGTKGWKDAQVTSGGVPLSEVNTGTMESKLIRGLFFAGEILDYDGACGGFNLNWAFATGLKAGRSALGSAANA
ncbi:MAG: aminoacetone oxidase family FAD-binding enzyme [Clostridiales Family XIII bacterium]|jgi:predicted Rossmann fold flavoprotein|nr:aminoacetone oxidase family FAD-binding enzyme [Clostridiales Family XIII bacterium]